MTLTKSTPDHVLIVDDQEYTLESARAVMESVGYEVATLSDPTKALQLLHDFREGPNPIDLVITDLIMPEREGLETITRLRQSTRMLPIIAISGGGRIGADDYLESAAQLGANATISKPFNRSDLVSTVSELLATSGG